MKLCYEKISCESVPRRNGFSFQDWQKIGNVQTSQQLFQIGGYTHSIFADFLLKQTNKGVVRSDLNTKYFKFPFVLLYVQLYNFTMIAMITMPVVCFGHSLQQIGCAVR